MLVRDWCISHRLFQKIYVGQRLVYLPPVIPKNICWLEVGISPTGYSKKYMLVRDWYISHQLFPKIYVGQRLVYLPPVIPKNICWLETGISPIGYSKKYMYTPKCQVWAIIKKYIFWSEIGTLYISNRLFPKERNMLVRDCYIVLLTQA